MRPAPEDAPSFEAVPRRAMSEFLQRAAKAHGGSTALGRVVDLLRANNPFSTVLAEIEKMISLLAAEGAKDKKQHDWCTDERQKTDQSILDTEAEITNLDVDIQKLDLDIEDPQTGLKDLVRRVAPQRLCSPPPRSISCAALCRCSSLHCHLPSAASFAIGELPIVDPSFLSPLSHAMGHVLVSKL